MKQRTYIDRMVKLGMLTALSIILVYAIHFPIFPAASYLEYDMADVPILIGTFLYGPWWGLALTAVVSVLQWLLWLACWLVTGAYATASWRRGGQTLGMRPWRLKLVACDGDVPTWRALWLRYAVGLLSLLAGGLGFWWAWWDRDRLAWHDRASGTRLVRLPKPNP